MTISQQFLLVVLDHHCFSLVSKPCLLVWVCPMISLKARLSLAHLMVSLIFHSFPVFTVGFSDFITSSFEPSSIIWSLISWIWIPPQLIWMVILILFVFSTNVALLSTQHYKVMIKGKVEQSWEWSSALPYTSV